MDEQKQLLNVLDSIETAFEVAQWPSLDDGQDVDDGQARADASAHASEGAPTTEPPNMSGTSLSGAPPNENSEGVADATAGEAAPVPAVVRPPSIDVGATRRTYPESPPPIQRVPKLRLSTRAFLEQFHRITTP